MKQTYAGNKNCRVQIKLDESQKEMIKKLSEQVGKSISYLILQELHVMMKETSQ